MSAIHPRTAYFLLVRGALKFTDEVRKHVESIHSALLFFVVHVQFNLYIVHTYIYWPLRLSSGIKFQCVQKYHKNIVKQPAGLEMGRIKTAFSCDWQEVNHAFRSVF